MGKGLFTQLSGFFDAHLPHRRSLIISWFNKKLGTKMGTRVLDATIIGLILISLIFMGRVFLIIDIPIFNYVDPYLLEMTILGLFLGLAFGLVAGYWYTKLQLRVLSEKTEVKGLGDKKAYYALFSGLAVFLIYSFFVFYYRSAILGNSLFTFVISATFTAYIIRLVLVSSWEKRTKNVVMMGRNNFYILAKQ